MKQILQNIKDGCTHIADVPTPMPAAGEILLRTRRTLISAGTERMLVDFGKANWLEKARQQPDKVKMVLEKVRTDGFSVALEAVRSKLDQPLAIGYCNVGVVQSMGSSINGFAVGERIVSNGKHAELVCVPKNLCARIPDAVSDDHAAFTVLAAIGLQGIRLASPTIGECVAVTGLGPIGLLTVQMLRAQGCRVLGIDRDRSRLALAERFGAETVNANDAEAVLAAAAAFSRGRGMDAVLITASSSSNEPITLAARMSRKRGRIVLIGVTGLELSRADFFEKELSFQVSCSYGPGRYDPSYEQGGHDYPVGFVRWTEQRNFEAVLDLMTSGALDVSPLISHRFELSDAEAAYELLAGDSPSLGIVLNYPQDDPAPMARTQTLPNAKAGSGKGDVVMIGAGNYASRTLIPAFSKAGAGLQALVSATGVTAVHHGKKHGFAQASTDTDAAIAHVAADTVVIATRHNSHARYILQALSVGKHVYCEKPLCLTLEELAAIEIAARANPSCLLMVGFNRRFAPQVRRIKQLLSAHTGPKSFVMNVNAGIIASDHWTQDRLIGGGRIVGEACHFIDLLRHLAGSPIVSADKQVMDGGQGDTVTLSLRFADGSIGTVHYFANGHKSVPKERLEVFCGGRTLQLNNFRTLKGFGWPSFRSMNLWRQDKGQYSCVQAFMDAIRSGDECPIPLTEVLEISRISIELA